MISRFNPQPNPTVDRRKINIIIITIIMCLVNLNPHADGFQAKTKLRAVRNNIYLQTFFLILSCISTTSQYQQVGTHYYDIISTTVARYMDG